MTKGEPPGTPVPDPTVKDVPATTIGPDGAHGVSNYINSHKQPQTHKTIIHKNHTLKLQGLHLNHCQHFPGGLTWSPPSLSPSPPGLELPGLPGSSTRASTSRRGAS